MKKPFYPGVEMVGLGLFIPKEKTLIVADLHLGYEAALNKQGVFLPRFNFKDIKAELKSIFKRAGRLKRVVIAGDLKHEFGNLAFTEWREVLDSLGFMLEHADNLVLVQGNHDKILGPIAERSKMTVLKQGLPLLDGEILVLHGDKIPEKSAAFKKAKVLVVGHEHPVVALQEEGRREKFKCFLKGKWKGKTVLALPSLIKVTQGSNILNETILSPFLKDIENFEAWLVEDKPYYFGKVGRLL